MRDPTQARPDVAREGDEVCRPSVLPLPGTSLVYPVRAIAPKLPPALVREHRTPAAEQRSQVARLWSQSLAKAFAIPGAATHPLSALCEAIVDCPHSTPRYDGDEVCCVRSQDVGWGMLDLSRALRTSPDEYQERTKRAVPRAGDVILVREGDVGRCGVVSDSTEPFSLGQRVMLLRPRVDVIDPHFLALQLMSPRVLDAAPKFIGGYD